MDINKWLLNKEQVQNNKYSTTVNELLSLYIHGLHEFYELDDTEDIEDFFRKANSVASKKSELTFLEWIKEKGFNQMKKTLLLNLPNDATIIAKLEYIKSILNDELSWTDRDKKSTRACIVNTLSNLSEQIIQLSNISMQKEELSLSMNVNEKIKKGNPFKNKVNPMTQDLKPLETVVFYYKKFRSCIDWKIIWTFFQKFHFRGIQFN